MKTMNKEKCITKYKPREKRYQVCKCGHYDYYHEGSMFSNEKCEKCMCDKYKKIGDLTLYEIEELKTCEDHSKEVHEN